MTPTSPYHALARSRKADAMARVLWTHLDDAMRTDLRVLDQLHDWPQLDRNTIARHAAESTPGVADAPPSEGTWSETLRILSDWIVATGPTPLDCSTCDGTGIVHVPRNCGHGRGCPCGGREIACGDSLCDRGHQLCVWCEESLAVAHAQGEPACLRCWKDHTEVLSAGEAADEGHEVSAA